MTDRGSAVVVDYLTVLGIVTLLVVSLFLGMSGFVEGQREQAIRSELDMVGNRLAADIGTADRLSRGAESEASVVSQLPDRVAGIRYKVSVAQSGSGEYELTLRSLDPEVAVTVSVRSLTPLEEGTVDGGTLALRYDPDTDKVVVENA